MEKQKRAFEILHPTSTLQILSLLIEPLNNHIILFYLIISIYLKIPKKKERKINILTDFLIFLS